MIVLCAATPSRAVTIFDTLPASPTFLSGASVGDVFLLSEGVIANFEGGVQFSVPGGLDFFLTSIDVALDSGGVEIRVWTDAAGQPGVILEAATVPLGTVQAIYTATFGGTTVLEAEESSG